jgi:hypothetical protein
MRKPPHYIEILSLQSHLLIPHLMNHRGSSENRDLRSSRDYFLLIKLSSSSVVTSIWSHQNRILIFVLIDFSTIPKISRYEKNHLDLNKSSRLNDRKTTRFEVNRLMKKLTIRIVSNKQMRSEAESFMHEEWNDDVMKQKSADQIRWSNHLIKKISSRKKISSIRSRFAISSIHLIISNYHDIASSTIFQHTFSAWHLDAQTDRIFWLIRWVMSIKWSCLRNFSCFCLRLGMVRFQIEPSGSIPDSDFNPNRIVCQEIKSLKFRIDSISFDLKSQESDKSLFARKKKCTW